MTVKEYLKQFEGLSIEIIMKSEIRQGLHDSWTPQTTPPTKSQTSAQVPALVALKQYYSTEIDRLYQLWHDIQLMIDSLDDPMERIVLTKKYINQKQPDEIAAEIPCDVRTVYRWLNEAIDKLQAQHPDRFETC